MITQPILLTPESLDSAIAPLELPISVARTLRADLMKTDPHKGPRTGFALAVRELVRLQDEALCEKFDAYMSQFPTRSALAWMPHAEFVLACVCASRLCKPHALNVRTGLTELVAEGYQHLESIQTVKTIRMVVVNLSEFIAESFRQRSLYQNYGVYDIEAGPRKVVIHASEHHTRAARYYTEAFFAAIFRLYEVEGQLEFEIISPTSFTLTASW